MEVDSQALDKVATILKVELKGLDFKVLQKVLAEARALPITYSYQWLGKLESIFHEYEAEFGSSYVEFLARYLLLVFTNTSEWRPRCSVPDSVADELKIQRDLIYKEVISEPAGHYYPFRDAFYKDFSLLRGKSMPVYAGIVDTYSQLWRRPLKFGPFSQRFRFFLHLLKKPIGNRFYFQHHVHKRLLPHFNPSGRLRAYELVAELLEANVDHKGFSSLTWYYDPQLEWISPRLIYLARDPILYGAELFHLGADESGNALAKSETRKVLYEQGKYIPQSYMLVWHRKPMMRWRKSLE